MTDRPRFGVVGAGATGALIAASLADAGYAVTLIARGASLDHIRKNGIRITRPDGSEMVAHPDVAAAGERVEPVDVAIFSVKSYDTADAARALGPLVRDTGHVLCLQNGVENEQVLSQFVGEGRVIPGVLYVGAERTGPGAVACSTQPRVVFGRGKAEESAPIEGIEAALKDAGVTVELSDDILAAKWQKFIFNCGLNPLTATTGLKLGQILANEEGLDLFDRLIGEAIEAAEAESAPVGPETREKVMETARRMNISSSMAEDLAAGRPLELEAFCGYVRRLGGSHGVPTPVTGLFYRLLKLADTQRRA